MSIEKSTRHQKIIGNFGENVVCNWLSRSGFEVTIVDHTGIDVIAYNPKTKQRLGITIKSRTRNLGKEKTHVNMLSYQNGKNDREMTLAACKAFACDPWIAVYVETSGTADLYLTSLENYDKNYRGKKAKAIDDWKMNEKARAEYENDTNVRHVRIVFDTKRWNWQDP